MRLFNRKKQRVKKEDLSISNVPRVFKSEIPGNMSQEDWAAGGFSKFNHPTITVDVPFQGKHVRFERLTPEQAEVLNKLSDFHQLQGVRRSALVSLEKNC